MDKKTLYHIIEWGVALAACVWLIWKIVTYDNYAALWESLCSMNLKHYIALLVCIALMPLNMTLEAWRWKTLVPMSWHDAHYQVYYSKLAGLITPWRLGEYPARALLMSESPITNHPYGASRSEESPITNRDLWSRVLSMGAVGSMTMTAAIVIAGIAAMIISNFQYPISNIPAYYLLVLTILLFLILALIFAPRLLRRWATVSRRLILISLAQSLIRLFCWCVQLYLVLFALGVFTNLQSPIFNLPIYYLLVTITPSVPIAEVGIRGAWAIVVFGSMNAAFAGVLLWVINTLLPCCIWPFLRKNAK